MLRFPKGYYNANLRDAAGVPSGVYYVEMELDPVNGAVAYPNHHIFLASNTHDWGNNSSNQNDMKFHIKLRYKLIHPSGDFDSTILTQTFGNG